MKKLLSILIFSTLLACGTQESIPIIGSWSQCLRDGTYKEYKITNYYTTTSVSDFPKHDYDDGISFYKSNIQDSLLIISQGINVDLINPPETLRIESISYDKITIENQFGLSELIRLKNEIPDIDSTNFELWRKSYLNEFLKRAKLADCPDLRTEEEKNPPIELGVIEDDFEELIDIDELPKWAAARFSKYEQAFDRSFKLSPSFLEADFSGDGTIDIVISVSKKSDAKKGVLFLLAENDLMFLAGAGNSFGSGGDNFDWADSWEIFDERLTHETTFLENGDVDGEREVKLDHAAISIREDEGSGGLIYFNGEKLISIHQGD
jgi:hypothetical protein